MRLLCFKFNLISKVDLLVKEFEQFNINLNEKELSKIQKISDSNGKVSKYVLLKLVKTSVPLNHAARA